VADPRQPPAHRPGPILICVWSPAQNSSAKGSRHVSRQTVEAPGGRLPRPDNTDRPAHPSQLHGPTAGCREEQRGTVLKGHRFPVQGLAFGPDGTTLISAASYLNIPVSGGQVVAWDVETGTRLSTRTEPLSSLSCLAFAPDGQHLAAAQARSLWLWDTPDSHAKGR
jgi:WD40 repeat protein